MSPSVSGSKAGPGVNVALEMSNTPLEILGCFFTDDLLDYILEISYKFRYYCCASSGPQAGYIYGFKVYTGQDCGDIP